MHFTCNSTRCVVLDIFWVALRGYSRMFDQSRVLNSYRYISKNVGTGAGRMVQTGIGNVCHVQMLLYT